LIPATIAAAMTANTPPDRANLIETTNRIVGGWGLNSCGLDATIPFSTVARRWQKLAPC
jgi:hypothetical protein